MMCSCDTKRKVKFVNLVCFIFSLSQHRLNESSSISHRFYSDYMLHLMNGIKSKNSK